MLVLALDTAMNACSVALWRDGAVLAAEQRFMERGQAEQLIPLIAACFADTHLGVSAVDRIAVTIGPGSFTGVRVGLAAARGLALAHEIPVCGFTTGRVLAAAAVPQVAGARAILSLVDTKRDDFYAECFDASGTPLGAPAVLSATDVDAWLSRAGVAGLVVVVGDGAGRFAALGKARDNGMIAYRGLEAVVVPDPAVLARLAASAAVSASDPQPLYIRPPDVTLAP